MNRKLSEAEIDARVERMTDHLDRLLLSGDMTQKNYNAAMDDLYAWARMKETQR